MSYQPQISTISGTAPPSYIEAISQPSPSKDGFPVPPSMPQPYGSYVPPSPIGGQYGTTSANYQEYNVAQPPYNPMYVSSATVPNYMQSTPTVTTTQPMQRPCVVTTTIVRRKRNNRLCSSCVRIIALTTLILVLVSCLLKIIIASMRH